jgi:hypothetical protein
VCVCYTWAAMWHLQQPETYKYTPAYYCIHIHMYLSICRRVCVCVCVCVACMRMCVYVYVCVCYLGRNVGLATILRYRSRLVCVSMYVCVCVYIYVCVYDVSPITV